ncbi:hypothetical protein C8R43DRAFT_1204024 [Mycena crocata]|nr:hypothetical protein C8R43DRAFT_1204024 [Mycena crocata]
MSRWTQNNEDLARLPAGMQRIGYDADSAQYSFRDMEGNIYLGPSHQQYGLLISLESRGHDRQRMFASEKSNASTPRPQQAQFSARDQPQRPSGSTFHDILPAHLITTAPPPMEEVSGWTSFVDALGRSDVMNKILSLQSNQKSTPRGKHNAFKAPEDKLHFVLLDEKAVFCIN